MSPALLSLKLHQSIAHAIHDLNAVDYLSLEDCEKLIEKLVTDLKAEAIRGPVNNGAAALIISIWNEYKQEETFTFEDLAAQIDGILLDGVQQQTEREQ